MSSEIGNVFADILSIIEPIIVSIADGLGIGFGSLLGFVFGGIQFLITEIFFR
jgi:hypothetical protein